MGRCSSAKRTMVEERGKGGEEEDKAVGRLGGAQVELMDFVTGRDAQRWGAASHLRGWRPRALGSVRAAGGENARNRPLRLKFSAWEGSISLKQK